MGVSRNTVARALTEPLDRSPKGRGRKSTVDEYRPQIEEWLQGGLSVVRMLELARGDPDHPYRGGRSTFGERVRRIRAEIERQNRDVPIRFEGLPGEYLQVDWGEIRVFYLKGPSWRLKGRTPDLQSETRPRTRSRAACWCCSIFSLTDSV